MKIRPNAMQPPIMLKNHQMIFLAMIIFIGSVNVSIMTISSTTYSPSTCFVDYQVTRQRSAEHKSADKRAQPKKSAGHYSADKRAQIIQAITNNEQKSSLV